jgi:hypothetical protein
VFCLFTLEISTLEEYRLICNFSDANLIPSTRLPLRNPVRVSRLHSNLQSYCVLDMAFPFPVVSNILYTWANNGVKLHIWQAGIWVKVIACMYGVCPFVVIISTNDCTAVQTKVSIHLCRIIASLPLKAGVAACAFV